MALKFQLRSFEIIIFSSVIIYYFPPTFWKIKYILDLYWIYLSLQWFWHLFHFQSENLLKQTYVIVVIMASLVFLCFIKHLRKRFNVVYLLIYFKLWDGNSMDKLVLYIYLCIEALKINTVVLMPYNLFKLCSW